MQRRAADGPGRMGGGGLDSGSSGAKRHRPRARSPPQLPEPGPRPRAPGRRRRRGYRRRRSRRRRTRRTRCRTRGRRLRTGNRPTAGWPPPAAARPALRHCRARRSRRSHRQGHEGLGGVQPVLGLVPDHRVGPVDDRRRSPPGAAAGRQRVHVDAVPGGQRHALLVGRSSRGTCSMCCTAACRSGSVHQAAPALRVDDVRALEGGVHVVDRSRTSCRWPRRWPAPAR